MTSSNGNGQDFQTLLTTPIFTLSHWGLDINEIHLPRWHVPHVINNLHSPCFVFQLIPWVACVMLTFSAISHYFVWMILVYEILISVRSKDRKYIVFIFYGKFNTCIIFVLQNTIHTQTASASVNKALNKSQPIWILKFHNYKLELKSLILGFCHETMECPVCLFIFL